MWNGTPLDELMRQIPSHLSHGAWQTNKRFEEVDTALANGIQVSAWDEMNELDRAYVLARKRVRDKMRAWENYLDYKALQKRQQQGN